MTFKEIHHPKNQDYITKLRKKMKKSLILKKKVSALILIPKFDLGFSSQTETWFRSHTKSETFFYQLKAVHLTNSEFKLITTTLNSLFVMILAKVIFYNFHSFIITKFEEILFWYLTFLR